MTREELIQYVSDQGIRWKESTFLKHGILDSFLALTEQYSGSFDYKSKCLRSDAENKCKCCGKETEWSRWIQRWTYYCPNCDPQLNTARLDKDKVLQYYDVHGYAATLAEFGISAHSLGKLGITKTVDQQRRYRKYADAYLSGKSIQKVADEFGTSKAHVRAAMRMYDIPHHSHSEVCKMSHKNKIPECQRIVNKITETGKRVCVKTVMAMKLEYRVMSITEGSALQDCINSLIKQFYFLIAQDYSAGMSIAEICNLRKTNYTHASRALKMFDIPLRSVSEQSKINCKKYSRPPGPAHNRAIVDEGRICQEYQNGKSALWISQQEWCTVSNVTVMNIIKRNGYNLRDFSEAQIASRKAINWPPVAQPRKITWGNLTDRKNDSAHKIAKDYNCHPETVRLEMYRQGLWKRKDTTTVPERVIHALLDEYKIPYEKHNRRHIYPKELDIYIPDHRLAIEVNGLYWHSTDTAMKDNRHIEKFTTCRSVGIRLLQFTDRDIIEREELIKSMLAVRLGIAEKIMARKCSVTEISTRIANQFYQQWHYQGATTNSAKSMALMYQNEVVALLSYRQTKDETIIDRYACKPFTTVIGGFTKLESRLSGKLVTFSLGLISDGSLYRNNGYTTEGYSRRAEFYVTDGQILWNRQKFMKTKMPKLFGSGFDSNKTEWQNIVDNGLRLYFGAGITKWVKEKGL